MIRFIECFSLLLILGILLICQPVAAQELNPLYNQDLAVLTQVNLMVDGIAVSDENKPLLLPSGRTVISLQSLQNVIPFQQIRGQNEEITLFWKQNQIQFTPGNQQVLLNAIPRNLEPAPIKTADGNCLLPLRPLGEMLGYQVIYDSSSQSIQLNSAGYQPAVPQTVQIDYNRLPTWGSIFSVPGLTDLWKGETIVAGYFTKLVNSPAGRTTNIILSSAKINGKILQADEVFSFNQTVGPRSTRNGYQNAKVFEGTQVIDGIGGGICQTSSTLYNVALEAGLSVLERYPHSLKVLYVPPNRDATVSWGSADFKFRNSSGFPLKILCKVESGYVFAVFATVQADSAAVPVPN